MVEAVKDVVAALKDKGIRVYPSEGAITSPGDIRIVYSPRLEITTWAYPALRGVLMITFTVISHTPDREVALTEATNDLIQALNTIYGARVRATCEALYADEATLRADVVASWPVITNQPKEDI